MKNSKSKPAVILVADRTLSANYRTVFEGIFATMQTRQVPLPMMKRFLAPPVKTNPNGSARLAPIGIRRIESSLIASKYFTPDQVITASPESLPKLLGPETKIVAFSSSDPLGCGMSNTTTNQFCKGTLYTKYFTAKLLKIIKQAKEKYNFKVIAGGAGSWQWDCCNDTLSRQTIDTVFHGYFENIGPDIFADIANGDVPPKSITEKNTAVENIKPLRAGAVMGALEISRGCGRGCKFCTMASKKMEHLPHDTILADMETNIAAGATALLSGSEDFFRYGSENLKPNPEKICDLLEKMARLKDAGFLQIDHANITSAAQLSLPQLKNIRRLLNWQRPAKYLWVNMGVENANGKLVHANCPGKTAPFRPEDWLDIVMETVIKLNSANFFCVISLVLGLPGETPQDVNKTIELVDFLQKQKAVVFPVFYEPYLKNKDDLQLRFTTDKMTHQHLQLFRKCYEINFKKVPLLFYDNQRAAKVSWAKRTTTQLLGKTEIITWRRNFKNLDKKISACNKSNAVHKAEAKCI